MTKNNEIVKQEDVSVEEFNHSEFGNLTTFMVDEDVWFLGNEVAEALGYKDTDKAVRSHVRDKHKKVIRYKDIKENLASDKMAEALKQAIWSNPNDFSNKTLINEPGLYSLIMNSKLPGSERFQDWVYEDVLPSLRKHGGYIVGQEDMDGEVYLAQAFKYAYSVLNEKEEIIAIQQDIIGEYEPKAQFADALLGSDDSISIGEFAKYLRQNDVKVGRNILFEIFRREGYFISAKGREYNNPTQYSMERGWFELKKSVINSGGQDRVYKVTLITPKGQEYFMKKFLDGTLEV